MGKVYLVGAGPGDPELLTVRAARLLGEADVILHDALVTAEVLALANPAATVVDVGKRCDRKVLTQSEIDALMIAWAKRAQVVVRLKGGDPGILGRAGEEMETLTEAGIGFEVVPGVTAASASAAAAGVALTDRRFSPSLLLTTAHRSETFAATGTTSPGTSEAASAEWDKLVSSGATLAIYMPGSDYPRLSGDLRRAGVDPATPVVVISRAGRADQQMLRTDVAWLAAHRPLPSPALVIVGQCAAGPRKKEDVSAAAHALQVSEESVPEFFATEREG